ncbi:MAG: DNA-binding protein [Anaerolineales bacterium]|nr:MAG: DNA-binding protein [Anaerolineales bacterium]
MFTKSFDKATAVVVVGIAPGEMLLETVQAAIAEHDIQNGAVVSGIGTLKVCNMHHIAHTGFPPENRYYSVLKPLEVSNISGIIADGQAHLHMTVGYTDEWALAGHVEPGCEVLYLAEIVILKFNGMQLDRHYDAERRISLLGEK